VGTERRLPEVRPLATMAKTPAASARREGTEEPMAEREAPPDFEACMQRLDRIVQELESGQVPLEQAMKLFEEGLELGATCRSLLDAAQTRVEKLLERADGTPEAQPFEPPA